MFWTTEKSVEGRMSEILFRQSRESGYLGSIFSALQIFAQIQCTCHSELMTMRWLNKASADLRKSSGVWLLLLIEYSNSDLLWSTCFSSFFVNNRFSSKASNSGSICSRLRSTLEYILSLALSTGHITTQILQFH